MIRGIAAAGLLLVLPALVVTAEAPARAGGPTCAGEPATIVGTDGRDVLTGTPGPDVIVGRAGNDAAFGRGGADLICLGGGFDTVYPGSGADLVRSGPGSDLVKVGPGDTIESGDGNDQIEDLDGDGSATVKAGPGADEINLDMPTGGAISGGGGDDEVKVRTVPGVDLDLLGGADDNELTLTVDDSEASVDVLLQRSAGTLAIGDGTGQYGGWSTVFGHGDHSWTYRGTAAFDEVGFHDGSADVELAGGNDLAFSIGGESDVLDGGPGWDGLDAGGGDDVLYGGDGKDSLQGGDGFDYGYDPNPPNFLCAVEAGDCVVS